VRKGYDADREVVAEVDEAMVFEGDELADLYLPEEMATYSGSC